MTPRRQFTLPVGDLQMAVTEQGEGPLVLLCHGFPETSWSWRHQQQALAEAGYRAVAPDLRGYGATVGSARPDQCDVVSLTGDLVALVDALGGGPCHLVGHDFGALLSWHAAALRPDVFRTVACLSVGFPSFLTGPTPPLAWYRAMDLGWKNLGERRTARVTVPALYVVGTHDVVHRTTGGLLARMKDAVPNLDGIVKLEGCGHWTQQERPAEVTSALVEFFRRHG